MNSNGSDGVSPDAAAAPGAFRPSGHTDGRAKSVLRRSVRAFQPLYPVCAY